MAGGVAYRLRAGNLEKLNERLTVEKSAALKGNVLALTAVGPTTVVLTPGEVILFDAAMSRVRSIPVPRGSDRLSSSETGFLVYSASKVIQYTPDGDKKAERNGQAIQSAALIGDGRLVIVDKDQVKILDASGAQVWASDLGQDRLYSLYY